MADRIKTDDEKIKQIGEFLLDKAEEYKTQVNELFEKLNEEIGFDESHKTWYGPKAFMFINNVNKKRLDFVKHTNNMNSMGNNLIEQATNWNKFENS